MEVHQARGADGATIVHEGQRDHDHGVISLRTGRVVLVLLIAFRFINALCVATFFQPDEYFQSLEPAWEMAFGSQSGAWMTWEWKYQLRSSLHPALFAALYVLSTKLMGLVPLLPLSRATVIVLLPKLFQAVFAAFGDYFTWKLAERTYGRGSAAAWAALLLTVLNPWQWFCSTRTLSNSLEAVLTVAALYFWPWTLTGDPREGEIGSNNLKTGSTSSHQRQPTSGDERLFLTTTDLGQLRICLTLAGIACIIRPTNILIWASLVTTSAIRIDMNSISRARMTDLLLFVRETVLCGGIVVCAAAVSDRLYFGEWTFPPYQWLNFNITQSLAVFYGISRWDYYVSEGLPLLLTTYLPFALLAIWSSSSMSSFALPSLVKNIRLDMAFMVITMITTLSLISHKEVRFIHPLLPSLHVLTAPHILSFFTSQPLIATVANTSSTVPKTSKHWRIFLLILLVITNLAIGVYTTQVHQRGVIDVLAFVRHKYEDTYRADQGRPKRYYGSIKSSGHRSDDLSGTFAAFLMPCHSTPWRSHLVHPDLHAWALTCEPPLHIPADTPERAAYRDEADRFYDDPQGFLKREMKTKERPWPRYVVGFEGIEEALRSYLEEEMPGWKLWERWSGFNTHWHDDWRRKGRVVAWELVDGSETTVGQP